MPASSTSRDLERDAPQDSRFDRRFAEILDYGTEVFADKGYEGASMRDLSRLSGISLAGLYYYFESKEKLLYFIQKHTFNTIMGDCANAWRPAPIRRPASAASCKTIWITPWP